MVNNAQSTVQRRVQDLTDADVEVNWRSGAVGALYVMQAGLPHLKLPHLKERGGVIISFGSSTALRGDPTFGAFVMAKEAIWGAVASRGQRVGTARDQSDHRRAIGHLAGLGGFPQAQPGNLPQADDRDGTGPHGRPEEDIGCAVASLASDDMSYLTGTTIMLDGGRVPLS